MSLEDNNEEELVLRDAKTGEPIFGFETKAAKDEFLMQIKRGFRKTELIKQEGYTCGNCAAYPCFRHPIQKEPAGLCFQHVRQCRQECENYHYERYPADGGTCRLDGTRVFYEQECHIESVKQSRLQAKE